MIKKPGFALFDGFLWQSKISFVLVRIRAWLATHRSTDSNMSDMMARKMHRRQMFWQKQSLLNIEIFTIHAPITWKARINEGISLFIPLIDILHTY